MIDIVAMYKVYNDLLYPKGIWYENKNSVCMYFMLLKSLKWIFKGDSTEKYVWETLQHYNIFKILSEYKINTFDYLALENTSAKGKNKFI